MSILFKTELTCPVCATQFATTGVVSTNRIGQDTDFRPHTLGTDPLPYYVHVCPNCCFAAFEGDFDSVQESVQDYVLSGAVRDHPVCSGEEPSDLSGSSKYLLAAQCYEYDNRATQLRLGDLYLRASWCARQEGNPSREQQCQLATLLRFEEALTCGEVNTDQELTISYLIGELYRRLGRYELAVAVLQQASEASAEDGDSRLLHLIRCQRQAAVDHECQNMTIEV